MRICSLFSSATELLYAIGAGRAVVGRSELCDYPPSARQAPVVVRSRIASERLSSRGIHHAVQRLTRLGAHHYHIDVELLKRLRPDVLITQTLCNVCAASHQEVQEAVEQLSKTPKILTVNAERFADVFKALDALGRSTGHQRQATRLSAALRRDVEQVQARVNPALSRKGVVNTTTERPRVWCAEWLEPPMAAGHWVPELIAMAGGRDGLGRAGKNSVPLPWQTIRQYDPEVILVMPCSFSINRTLRDRRWLTQRPGWKQLRAVKTGRVFAVDTAFFHRPGPRLVEGLKTVAALLHPDRFPRPSIARARRFV